MPERMKYIMKDIKICVLGGDARQAAAAREMCKAGYKVSVFGLDGELCGAEKSLSLEAAVGGAALVLTPLPFSTDGLRLFCPLSEKDIKLEDLYKLFEPGQFIAGGKLNSYIIEKIEKDGRIIFDYVESERFSVMNAIPTAEGAVAIAMNELKITLFGSKTAVVGYGRIGRVLSKTLKALGSDVTVFARSESALSWAKAEGYTAVHIRELSDLAEKYDAIFNTVPHVVVGRDVLEKTKSDVVIIDLASSPGGVDFERAKKMNRNVIWALSLPGKVAPETAGKIITDCVLEKYKEART